MRKIICDKNFIQNCYHRSEREEPTLINKDDILIYTFILLEEFYSSPSWAYENTINAKYLNYMLSQNHEFRLLGYTSLLLNKMGYTSLTHDPNFEFNHLIIEGLISRDQETVEMISRNIITVSELEVHFVGAMSEYITQIKKSKYFQNRSKNTLYHDLNDDYKNHLDKYAQRLIMLYAKYNLKHKQQELLSIDTFNLRPKDTNFKHLSAYLKLRAEGDPVLNDQYDYKYFEYLQKGDFLATDDKLMERVLIENNQEHLLIKYRT